MLPLLTMFIQIQAKIVVYLYNLQAYIYLFASFFKPFLISLFLNVFLMHIFLFRNHVYMLQKKLNLNRHCLVLTHSVLNICVNPVGILTDFSVNTGNVILTTADAPANNSTQIPDSSVLAN